jgi:hypothetical protein
VRIKTPKIANYIEKRLLKKIKVEVQDHILTNERDIESAIYYHLRDKIKNDDRLRLATNYTIKKVKVPGSNRAAKGKRSFRQPDIVVLRTAGRPKPLIAIEIKRKLRSNNTVNLLIKDVEKLELFKKKKIIEKGYILFVTNNYAKTAAEIEDKVNESVKVNGVKVLVTNPIENYSEQARDEYFKKLQTFQSYNYKKEKKYKRKRSKAAKKRIQTLGSRGLKRAAKKMRRTKKEKKRMNESSQRNRIRTRKRKAKKKMY